MMDAGYILETYVVGETNGLEKDIIFRGLFFCKDKIWDTLLALFLGPVPN